MFAQVAEPALLTVVFGEQDTVAVHDGPDLAQVRRRGEWLAAQSGRQFGEQPWPAQTTTADDDAVAEQLENLRARFGTLKGVGRIYQQTFVDTYSKWAAAKLYTTKTPITSADLLNDRVLPFFTEQGMGVIRILTDRGTEYCGKLEHHDYQLYLALNDIEHSRTKITEVKKTIEDKKQKLDELKQQKKSLMDAGLALDSSNLDSAVQATLMESINDSLRDVENKAYDVSKDANQNLQSLEQIRQNVDDEITDSQKAKKKLDQTKKLLDTLGVGKSLEKGVNKLDDHLQEATGLKGEVISAMQDLEKVYRQLDQI